MIAWTHLLFLPLLAHIVSVIRWTAGMRHALTPEGRFVPTGCPLTVILPVRNEADAPFKLLSDLAAQTLPPNGSSWWTTPRRRHDAVGRDGPWPFALTLMANPGQGKRPACPQESSACTTTWAIGVDGDTRLGPEAIPPSPSACRFRSGLGHGLAPLRIANAPDGAPTCSLDNFKR